MAGKDSSVDALNAWDAETLRVHLQRCCGAARWAQRMLAQRPFADWDHVRQAADDVWQALAASDWREAFAHHPKIGDMDSLRAKFAGAPAWSAGEQARVQEASEAVLHALAQGNRAYEAKFGYIFIVCAAGKSAEEMLSLLRQRLPHDPETELRLAAEEQRKITQLRLDKLRLELEAQAAS